MPTITQQELARYQRQTMLPEIGIDGQQKLKDATVLVVGVGGLGAPVLQYLCAAGIGTLGFIDADVISETNLQRQILFTSDEIDKSKVEKTKEKLHKLNPYCQLIGINERLTTTNAFRHLAKYDVVVDCTDNFRTRYILDKICEQLQKPLVYGSIQEFRGQLSVFHYKKGISYRTLFPDEPDDSIMDGEPLGVLGAIAGVIGSLQATEVLKIVTRAGTVLSGQLLIYDALRNTFRKLTFVE